MKTFPNYNYDLVIQGSSQNYNKEVHTSYYFRTVAQIKRETTLPQVPATQYDIQTISELGEPPMLKNPILCHQSFVLQGNVPDYEIKLRWVQCHVIWGSAPDHEIKLRGVQCLVIRVSAPDYEMKCGSSCDSTKIFS